MNFLIYHPLEPGFSSVPLLEFESATVTCCTRAFLCKAALLCQSVDILCLVGCIHSLSILIFCFEICSLLGSLLACSTSVDLEEWGRDDVFEDLVCDFGALTVPKVCIMV